jgi:hypothetical protein
MLPPWLARCLCRLLGHSPDTVERGAHVWFDKRPSMFGDSDKTRWSVVRDDALCPVSAPGTALDLTAQRRMSVTGWRVGFVYGERTRSGCCRANSTASRSRPRRRKALAL